MNYFHKHELRGALLSSRAAGLGWAAFLFLMTIGCKKGIDKNDLRHFKQVNLVANKWAYGPKFRDSTLQNAWGLAFSPNGFAWVNANGTGLSEVYTAEGATVRPPVLIPSPSDTMGGTPSGIVFSNGKGFKLSNKLDAAFLMVGEDGVLSGWNSMTGNKAMRIMADSVHARYKGVTIASNNGANFLYAANFQTRKVDVWDESFTPVSMSFKDPGIPAGYSPFNIQSIGSWLYVSYALVKPNGDDSAGPGFGFVSIFRPDGSFVRRFATRGSLNAPWGLAMAPAGFLEENDMNQEGIGDGSGKLGQIVNTLHQFFDRSQPTILVGNFGDGKINVFTEDGHFQGYLQAHGKSIVINGLWGLMFPPTTATSIDPKRLYFTAGPRDEMDGLFGYLIKE